MCGITGFFDLKRTNGAHTMQQVAIRMGDSLRHRGPDAGGVWADAEQGIALAHRRLAIIDLSPAGAQPMHSADGRFVISYNGEIYNFPALVKALRASGHEIPAGAGDTAVLLAAISVWGVLATLEQINGIYAFALWDRQQRTLTLARDRIGVKPLYWAEANGKYLFGSELRALLEHSDCPRRIDRQSLAHYFRAGHVPAPRSIFKDIHKLPPAHYLTLAADAAPRLACYWDLTALANAPKTAPASFAEAAEVMHGLLRDAVQGQMLADVPLGALLSGGIDSSVVTALMQSQSDRPVKTFSVGFGHQDFDEAPQARAIARHLGTAHTEIYVTEADTRAVIPQLPQIYDEPFADSSQIPTYLISRIARQQVTVALSGDGGDEVFLGYNRYRAWAQMERLPLLLRRALARACAAIPAEKWNRLGLRLPARLHIPQLGDKLAKFSAFGASDVAEVYRRLASWWPQPEELVSGAAAAPMALPEPAPDDPVAAMQYWDLSGYLPDDVLTKVDRASMAVALEVRVPLLDHRVVEYALSLPRDIHLEGGVTKRLLRAAAAQYLPPDLLARPKSGFGVPLAAWLRGPLKSWAEDWLAPDSLRDAGLNLAPIRRAWEDHLALRGNNQHQIWTVLMYLCWRHEWRVED